MKNGGRIHKLWIKWAENAYLGDHLWPWRFVCWADAHELYWNYGRTYCVICNKTVKKDPWRIKRDNQRNHNGTH